MILQTHAHRRSNINIYENITYVGARNNIRSMINGKFTYKRTHARQELDIDDWVNDPKSIVESRNYLKRGIWSARHIAGEIVNFGFGSLSVRSNITMRSKLQRECILAGLPCHDLIAIITVLINSVWYVQLHISRSVATLLRSVIQQMLNWSVCQGQKRSRPSNEYVAICFGKRNFDVVWYSREFSTTFYLVPRYNFQFLTWSIHSADMRTRGRMNSLEADGVTCARRQHRINNLMVSLLPPSQTYIYFESRRRRNARRKYGTGFRNSGRNSQCTNATCVYVYHRPTLPSSERSQVFFPRHLSGIAMLSHAFSSRPVDSRLAHSPINLDT